MSQKEEDKKVENKPPAVAPQAAPAPEANKIPNGPCIEMVVVGRNISYDEGMKKNENFEAESTIFFPTVGNKDMVQIQRYRTEKGYAVVGYHNFPPKGSSQHKEFAQIQSELDQVLSPPETRRRGA